MTDKIFDDFGSLFGTSNCDGSLKAGEFCALTVSIENAEAYACVVTAPSATNLRGSLVLHRRLMDDFDLFYFDPIRSVPLR